MKKTLTIILILSTLISKSQNNILKSEVKSKLPNKFLITDSGFYGLNTHCINYELFKATPDKLDIVEFNKFTNEITVKSIKHFKGNSIKNIQLVDFAKIQDQPAVIFAKEEDNAIILCYSLISNLEELNQFSKIEFSEFSASNTMDLSRKYSSIENIYSSKSPDGKSIMFYTYLKNDGKKINIKCFNNNLELKWEKLLEIPIKKFNFGNIKKTILTNESDLIFKVVSDNKLGIFKYQNSNDKIDEILVEIPENSYGHSNIFNFEDKVFVINLLEKKLSEKLIGININKLDVDLKIEKSQTIYEPFNEIKAFSTKIRSVLITSNSINFSFDDNDRAPNEMDNHSFIVSSDIDLNEVKIKVAPKPINGYFTDGNNQESYRFYLIENTNGLKFISNIGEKYIDNIENNKCVIESNLDTKLISLKENNFNFENFDVFQNNNLIQKIDRVDNNTLIFGYSDNFKDNEIKLGIIQIK
jgi:hypothetical protein